MNDELKAKIKLYEKRCAIDFIRKTLPPSLWGLCNKIKQDIKGEAIDGLIIDDPLVTDNTIYRNK